MCTWQARLVNRTGAGSPPNTSPRVRPKVPSLENVPGLFDYSILVQAAGRLRTHGFAVQATMLDPSQRAIPNHRPRVYTVVLAREHTKGDWEWPGLTPLPALTLDELLWDESPMPPHREPPKNMWAAE